MLDKCRQDREETIARLCRQAHEALASYRLCSCGSQTESPMCERCTRLLEQSSELIRQSIAIQQALGGGRLMSPPRSRWLDWLCLGLVITLLFALVCLAAPAPFARTPSSHSQRLHPSDLAGTWIMTWAGTDWTVTLERTGAYTCRGHGLVYTGTWALDSHGRLWITESSQPSDAQSWHSYRIPLCPRSLSGRCDTGSPGTEVRLRRR